MLSLLPMPAPAGDCRFASDAVYLPPAARAVMDLAPHQCRWPMGEPADSRFAFCPDTRLLRGRYCAVHARRARRGSRP